MNATTDLCSSTLGATTRQQEAAAHTAIQSVIRILVMLLQCKLYHNRNMQLGKHSAGCSQNNSKEVFAFHIIQTGPSIRSICSLSLCICVYHALYLFLVQLRASVAITRAQKQNMRRQFLHAQSTLNRTRNELKDCRNTAQVR